MANVFQRFLDLIPKQAEFVGMVQSAEHPNYKVLVVDGTGLVACTSATAFNVGDRVVIRGQSIIRNTPSGAVVQVEV